MRMLPGITRISMGTVAHVAPVRTAGHSTDNDSEPSGSIFEGLGTPSNDPSALRWGDLCDWVPAQSRDLPPFTFPSPIETDDSSLFQSIVSRWAPPAELLCASWGTPLDFDLDPMAFDAVPDTHVFETVAANYTVEGVHEQPETSTESRKRTVREETKDVPAQPEKTQSKPPAAVGGGKTRVAKTIEELIDDAAQDRDIGIDQPLYTSCPFISIGEVATALVPVLANPEKPESRRKLSGQPLLYVQADDEITERHDPTGAVRWILSRSLSQMNELGRDMNPAECMLLAGFVVHHVKSIYGVSRWHIFNRRQEVSEELRHNVALCAMQRATYMIRASLRLCNGAREHATTTVTLLFSAIFSLRRKLAETIMYGVTHEDGNMLHYMSYYQILNEARKCVTPLTVLGRRLTTIACVKRWGGDHGSYRPIIAALAEAKNLRNIIWNMTFHETPAGPPVTHKSKRRRNNTEDEQK